MRRNILINPMQDDGSREMWAALSGLDLAKNLGATSQLTIAEPGQTKQVAHGLMGRPRMVVFMGVSNNLGTVKLVCITGLEDNITDVCLEFYSYEGEMILDIEGKDTLREFLSDLEQEKYSDILEYLSETLYLHQKSNEYVIHDMYKLEVVDILQTAKTKGWI